MNKKEVLELKRRLKKDQATFSRLVGCYVDCNHEKVCKFGGKFLTLEEDEYYKYLEISNKVLSGTLGNNLLNLQFPLEEEEVGGRQQILMALSPVFSQVPSVSCRRSTYRYLSWSISMLQYPSTQVTYARF